MLCCCYVEIIINSFLRRSPTFTFCIVSTNYVAGPKDTDHFLLGAVSLVYNSGFFTHSRSTLNACELSCCCHQWIITDLFEAHFQKSRLFLSISLFVDRPFGQWQGSLMTLFIQSQVCKCRTVRNIWRICVHNFREEYLLNIKNYFGEQVKSCKNVSKITW